MIVNDHRGGRATARDVVILSIVAMAVGGARAAHAGGSVDFTDVTASVGLDGYIGQQLNPDVRDGDFHAPGGVFADLDNDGYPDLYLMRGLQHPNHLYLNVDAGRGARGFVRAPGDAGAGDLQTSMGALAADYDNDGDQDLYLINFNAPNVLFQNRLVETGSLLFVDVTAQTDPTPDDGGPDFGLGIAYYDGIALDNSLTAVWGDPDRDGDLDLFVGNHNGFYNAPLEGPFAIPGRRDVFYMNNGDGTFSDMTMAYDVPGFKTAGGSYQTANQRFSSSNAAIFADFDNDRWPDLFVTNKVGGPDDRDMLYRNLGVDRTGTWLGFELKSYDMAPDFGTYSGGAMGVDVADPDNDGDLDVYITDWSSLPLAPEGGANDLWVNLLTETGSLDFMHSDDAAPALYSWGAQFQDFDNDGLQDLHVACQNTLPNFLYMNLGTDILTGWSDVAPAEGMDHTANGRGDMTADFDRDGWVDMFVVNTDVPSILYENRTDQLHGSRRFLSIRLIGDPNGPGPLQSTRDAIGARVIISADLDGDSTVSPSERQIREVVSGSSNAASTSSLELEVGLGVANFAFVEILWPSGVNSRFTLSADQFITIDESLLATGDVDGDHIAGFTDLTLILQYWGLCDGVCPTDLNDNGETEFTDLTTLLNNWS